MAALAALGATAAVALGAPSAAPISNVTVQDPVGDAVGAGGDLQSVTYTVSADGILTFAATYANRSDQGAAPSTQFDILAPDGSMANIAAFSGYPSQLEIRQNGAWVEQHQLPSGTWAGHTFTISVALSDLQNTLHVPVTPTLQLETLSVEVHDDNSVSVDDYIPDNGWTIIATQAAPAITTSPTPPPTTPNTPPPHTSSAPKIAQATRHVGKRLEWTKLALSSIPAGAKASITCTKGCHTSERLAVSGGAAASKRFVGVSFARGTSFVVRVVRGNGTGWWWRETVASSVSTASGCIADGGKLVAGRSC